MGGTGTMIVPGSLGHRRLTPTGTGACHRQWKSDADVVAPGLAVLVSLSTLREGRLALTARGRAIPRHRFSGKLFECCSKVSALLKFSGKF